MGLPLFFLPARRTFTIHSSSCACAVALSLAILIPPALAQEQKSDDDPVRDASVTAKSNVSLPKNVRDTQKYDMERIGQRGIGKGFNLFSVQKERELGEGLAAAFDRTSKIISDPEVNDYVNRIAQKMVRYSDADIPFTVRIVDLGDTPRAYGLPGGFLYVDSALILASDGEAELAAMMAHEIAHVAARHATRALTRKRMCGIGQSLALLAGPAGMGAANVGGFAGPLSLKKFSRDAEYEADLLAMQYTYAAGYDPQALLDALEKLHALDVKRASPLNKIPGFHFASLLPFHNAVAKSMSDYPLMEERIGRLQAEIPLFLPTRRDYVLDTDEFQDVKARLLAARTPVLRHHGKDGDDKGPVLRRSPDLETASGTPFAMTFLEK